MIHFNKVSKKFGNKRVVLDDVSFMIEKGEFVFLIGPSGAGKTTLLRLLFRDMAPDSGSITMESIDIAKIPKKKIPLLRRKLGIIFQDFKLLFDKTVGENVAVALEIQAKEDAEIQKKVKEVLALVGLKDKKDYFPLQLSAGEMQRVAIARAIVGGPHVLLADEPTGNLDPKTSEDIMSILGQINKLGTTVIMATHDAEMVNMMKRRVITVREGKITKDQKDSKYE